ncbi:uncharacterized protein BXZ73DRAFT_105072 [Epithele typhae]|uniref:uncharacterized protein n=1 Tax=Epithele typhae TaxID=378194 RepID=UPI0020076B33|nr:uncharacterized protein BXZ73DRAFT_105072 [Epithele typhae]KAH9918915.1 hypothetical protein BXZ73DRAFT_105072 [Epithele typhae]
MQLTVLPSAADSNHLRGHSKPKRDPASSSSSSPSTDGGEPRTLRRKVSRALSTLVHRARSIPDLRARAAADDAAPPVPALPHTLAREGTSSTSGDESYSDSCSDDDSKTPWPVPARRAPRKEGRKIRKLRSVLSSTSLGLVASGASAADLGATTATATATAKCGGAGPYGGGVWDASESRGTLVDQYAYPAMRVDPVLYGMIMI